MKLDGRIARRISRRLEKFAAYWAALDDIRRQDATKMVVMVELVGGREKAAALLGVSDNTIDNHRKQGDIRHGKLRELTEHAGLPPAALYLQWKVEADELLFADDGGNLFRHPEELDRRLPIRRDDIPPLAYIPGYDEHMRPAGLAEEGGFPHLGVPQDYLERLAANPQKLLTMVAQDDGMVPEIEHGALLLVDTGDKQLTDGCIYVFRTAGGHILRRVRRLRNGNLQLLCADDQRHAPQRVKKADIAALEIIGRLRSHSRIV